MSPGPVRSRMKPCASLVKDHNMGIWNVTAALYGTQEQVDVNWKIVTAGLRQIREGEIPDGGRCGG